MCRCRLLTKSIRYMLNCDVCQDQAGEQAKMQTQQANSNIGLHRGSHMPQSQGQQLRLLQNQMAKVT